MAGHETTDDPERIQALIQENEALRAALARQAREDRPTGDEEPFRIFAEATFEGIVISDNGILLDINEQFAQMNGYTRSEVIGLPLTRFLAPEDHDRVLQAVRSGQDRVTEFTVLRKDGSTMAVEAHGRTVEWGGRMVRVTAMRDLTAQKQLQAEREGYQTRLERLLRASQQALAAPTMERLLQNVLDAACELTQADIGISGHDYRDGIFRVSAVHWPPDMPAKLTGPMFQISRGGVYMEALETGRIIRLTGSQLEAHPLWWGLPQGHLPLRGLLAAPLIARDGRPNGLIMVTHKQAGEFSAEDEAMFGQLAALTSMAVQQVEAREAAELSAARAAELLAENQRQREILEQLMDVAPVGIAVLQGPEHRFQYVNPCFKRMSRTGDAPLLGRPVAEIFPGARDTGTLPLLDEVFATGRPVGRREFETPNVPGGPTYWTYDAVPLREPDAAGGGVMGILVVEQDVSAQVLARKQVEELAREAQQHAAELSAVLDAIPDSLIMFGPDGEIVRANRSAELLFAVTPAYNQAPLRERFQMPQLARPDGRPVTPDESPVNRALRGEILRQEIMAFQRGSENHWLSVSAAPLRDLDAAKDKIIGAAFSITDITGLQRMQERIEEANENLEIQAEQMQSQNEDLQRLMVAVQAARHEAEQRAAELSGVFETMANGVLIFGPDATVLRANDEARSILGWTAEDDQRSVDERSRARRVSWPDGRPMGQDEAPVVRALHGETVRNEVIALYKPGQAEPRWVAVSAAPLRGPDGEITCTVANLVDVTEERRAQAQLEEINQELKIRGQELETRAEEIEIQAEELGIHTEQLQQRNEQLRRLTAELEEQRAGLEIILEQMPAGVLIAEAPSGRVVLMNRQAEELLRGPYRLPGTPADYMQYQSFYPDGRPMRSEDMPLARTIVTGERVTGEEIHFIRGDGTRGVQVASSSPVVDGSGQIKAGVLTFYDITDRKAAEEALRQAEQRYQSFVAHSTEAIWRIELDIPVPAGLPEDEQIRRLYQYGYVAECNDEMARMHGFESASEMVRMRLGQLMPRLAAANVDLLHAFIQGGYHLDNVESVEMGRQGEVRHFSTNLLGILDREGRLLVRIWGVKRDLTELKQAEEALREQARERAALDERQRLARDLHDAVSQTLFSASITADVLPRLYERDPAHGQTLLADLRRMNRGALAEMRTLLLELRPQALLEVDLGTLLRQLAEAAAGRSTTQVEVAANAACALPPRVQEALYRIAQEALNNVARHSEAGHAAVRLRCTVGADGQPQPGACELCIEDDGRGFDPDAVPANHFGLSIMEERARSIGATLTLTSQPGEGTRILVVWNSM